MLTKLIGAVVFWCCLASVPLSCFGQSYEMVEASLLARRPQLCGVRFYVSSERVFHISAGELARLVDDRAFVEAEQLLSINSKRFDEEFAMQFDPTVSDRPYLTKWTCHYTDLDSEAPIALKQAYLIVEDRESLVTEFRQAIDAKGSISPDQIASRQLAQRRTVGRSFLDLHASRVNHFGSLLTLDLRQLTIFNDPLGEMARKLGYELTFNGIVKVAGEDCAQFEGSLGFGDNKYEYNVAALRGSQTMVMKATIKKRGQLIQEYAVDAVSQHEGLVYPAKGRVSKYKDASSDLPFEYKFEVTRVEELDTSDFKNWVPTPSEGTFSFDGFSDSSTNIPFTSQTMEYLSMEHARIKNGASKRWIAYASFPLLLLLCWFIFAKRGGSKG